MSIPHWAGQFHFNLNPKSETMVNILGERRILESNNL